MIVEAVKVRAASAVIVAIALAAFAVSGSVHRARRGVNVGASSEHRSAIIHLHRPHRDRVTPSLDYTPAQLERMQAIENARPTGCLLGPLPGT